MEVGTFVPIGNVVDVSTVEERTVESFDIQAGDVRKMTGTPGGITGKGRLRVETNGVLRSAVGNVVDISAIEYCADTPFHTQGIRIVGLPGSHFLKFAFGIVSEG